MEKRSKTKTRLREEADDLCRELARKRGNCEARGTDDIFVRGGWSGRIWKQGLLYQSVMRIGTIVFGVRLTTGITTSIQSIRRNGLRSTRELKFIIELKNISRRVE